jgi:hypothetical protein
MTHVRPRWRTSVIPWTLLLMAVACMACSLPGCASTPAVPQCEADVPQAKAELPTRDYVAVVVRYLYRWHADETLLSSVSQYPDTELLARRLHPRLDADDSSQFCEVIFPRVNMRIVLKRADYLVEELGQRVRNDSFKVHSVGEYVSPPAARSAYSVFRFDRGELSDYLFRTRNDRAFPNEELLERLRAAVRKTMGERPADVEDGPAVVYVAPLSPVSNDLWVYWENGHRIIRFSSDADLTQRAYWDLAGVDVHVYDLREHVVVSFGEVPGSSKYVTRDWAARVLFNCIALGQKVTMAPAR